ncbi:putative GroES-like superfamily, groES chaperonin family, groES chaperonin superfamily [Helianthus anomalus]
MSASRTQTTRRRLSLQSVCFLEVLSLKKGLQDLFLREMWTSVFKGLLSSSSLLFQNKSHNLASSRHISISTSVEPSPSFSRHLHPADTSINLHLHCRRKLISVEALTSIDLHPRRLLLFFCLLTDLQLNSGKVIAVGPGTHDNSGNTIPVGVKEGDIVLLPEYGDTEVKLGEKEYIFCLFFYVDAVILVRHLLIC